MSKVSSYDERARGGRWILLAYVAALAVGTACVWTLRDAHPLVSVGVGDLAATLVVFAFSRAFGNSSFYDAYWSVGPIGIVAAFLLLCEERDPARAALVTVLVCAWGARLTFNWWRGWTGLSHEDWRYFDLRQKTGRAFFLVDLFGIHLFPTVQVFAGCVPLYFALSSTAPLGLLDGAAVAVTAAAIWIEARADKELFLFRRRKQPGEILATGLWSRSRHPNYFGEISFWWGILLFSVSVAPGAWIAYLGAPLITLMFVFISVPLIDKRSIERRPEYAEHARRLPAIFPRLWSDGHSRSR